jgi:hypothetical protein
MLQGLILIDALSSVPPWGKKAGGFFPQGGTCLADCVTWDFHGCYVQLKADLRSVFEFYVYLM